MIRYVSVKPCVYVCIRRSPRIFCLRVCLQIEQFLSHKTSLAYFFKKDVYEPKESHHFALHIRQVTYCTPTALLYRANRVYTIRPLDLKPQNQNHSLPPSTDSENILQPLLLPFRLPLRNLVPHLPILVVKIPVLLSRRLAPALRKPPGDKLLSVGLSLPPRRTLLLLDAVLLRSRKVVLAVFHRALIRTETRIGEREHRAEFLIDSIERNDEWREIERDTRWTCVSLPDEESLVVVVLGVLGSTFVDVCVLESGGEARVDLVVPAAADTPADAALGVEHLAYDLVGGRCLPTAGLEVELAHFARRPVLDFHHAVVVDSGVTGDDSDHRGGDLFPGVEFLLTASRGRA